MEAEVTLKSDQMQLRSGNKLSLSIAGQTVTLYEWGPRGGLQHQTKMTIGEWGQLITITHALGGIFEEIREAVAAIPSFRSTSFPIGIEEPDDE